MCALLVKNGLRHYALFPLFFSTEKCVNDRRMIHLRTGGCQGAGTCCCASNLGVVDAMIWGN